MDCHIVSYIDLEFTIINVVVLFTDGKNPHNFPQLYVLHKVVGSAISINKKDIIQLLVLIYTGPWSMTARGSVDCSGGGANMATLISQDTIKVIYCT